MRFSKSFPEPLPALLATGILLPLFAANLPAAPQSGPSAPKTAVADEPIHELRTPDGSRFLLVPRPLQGIVHWASFLPPGRIHEPRDMPGLAAACARSSLSGPAESVEMTVACLDTLARVDELAVEMAELRLSEMGRRGELEGELRRLGERLERRTAEAERLAPLDGFREMIAKLPVDRLRTETGLRGTVLQAQTKRSQLLAFASLMERRRRTPLLATLQRELLRERARMAANERRTQTGRGDARGSLVREALLLAMREHPLRDSLLPQLDRAKTPTREEALRFWQRQLRPERGVTVLVGDFDVERVREGLLRIFVRPATGRAAPRIADEAPQNGLRASDLVLEGPDRSVDAYRVPPDVPIEHLRALASLLDGQSGSMLSDLRLELGTRVRWQITPRLPRLGEPAFFVIETEERGTNSPLERRMEDALRRLRDGSAPESQLLTALQSERLQQEELREDSHSWAAQLARRYALGGAAALRPAELSPAALRRSAAKLLQETRRTRVRSTAPASESAPKSRDKTEKNGE
jgi:predicted Zn-dependent peptidase